MSDHLTSDDLSTNDALRLRALQAALLALAIDLERSARVDGSPSDYILAGDEHKLLRQAARALKKQEQLLHALRAELRQHYRERCVVVVEAEARRIRKRISTQERIMQVHLHSNAKRLPATRRVQSTRAT